MPLQDFTIKLKILADSWNTRDFPTPWHFISAIDELKFAAIKSGTKKLIKLSVYAKCLVELKEYMEGNKCKNPHRYSAVRDVTHYGIRHGKNQSFEILLQVLDKYIAQIQKPRGIYRASIDRLRTTLSTSLDIVKQPTVALMIFQNLPGIYGAVANPNPAGSQEICVSEAVQNDSFSRITSDLYLDSLRKESNEMKFKDSLDKALNFAMGEKRYTNYLNAINNDDVEMIKFLLEHDPSLALSPVSENGFDIYHYAIIMGKIRTVNYLHHHGSKHYINSNHYHLKNKDLMIDELTLAIMWGQDEVMKFFISVGFLKEHLANKNLVNCVYASLFINGIQSSAVRILIDSLKQLDLTLDNAMSPTVCETALNIPTITPKERYKILKLSLENGADVNQFFKAKLKLRTDFVIKPLDDYPMFFLCISEGYEREIKLFIKHGVDLYKKDSSGLNAMLVALYTRQYHIAELLFKSGYDHTKKIQQYDLIDTLFRTYKTNTENFFTKFDHYPHLKQFKKIAIERLRSMHSSNLAYYAAGAVGFVVSIPLLKNVYGRLQKALAKEEKEPFNMERYLTFLLRELSPLLEIKGFISKDDIGLEISGEKLELTYQNEGKHTIPYDDFLNQCMIRIEKKGYACSLSENKKILTIKNISKNPPGGKEIKKIFYRAGRDIIAKQLAANVEAKSDSLGPSLTTYPTITRSDYRVRKSSRRPSEEVESSAERQPSKKAAKVLMRRQDKNTRLQRLEEKRNKKLSPTPSIQTIEEEKKPTVIPTPEAKVEGFKVVFVPKGWQPGPVDNNTSEPSAVQAETKSSRKKYPDDIYECTTQEQLIKQMEQIKSELILLEKNNMLSSNPFFQSLSEFYYIARTALIISGFNNHARREQIKKDYNKFKTMMSHSVFAIISPESKEDNYSNFIAAASAMTKIIKEASQEELLNPQSSQHILTENDKPFYQLLFNYHEKPILKNDEECFHFVYDKLMPLISSSSQIIDNLIKAGTLGLLKTLFGFCGEFYNISCKEFLDNRDQKYFVNNTLRKFLENCRKIHNKTFHAVPDSSPELVIETYGLACEYLKEKSVSEKNFLLSPLPTPAL